MRRARKTNSAKRYRVQPGDDDKLYFRSTHRLGSGDSLHGIAFARWRALVDQWHGDPIFTVEALGKASPVKPPERSLSTKHRALRDTKRREVQLPDQVWLSFAVCGMDRDSCGWSGWIIEALSAKAQNSTPTSHRKGVIQKIAKRFVLRSADDEQICPICDRQLFRTVVKKQLFARSRG